MKPPKHRKTATHIEGSSPNRQDKSTGREIPIDFNRRQPVKVLTPAEKEKQLPKSYPLPPGTIGAVTNVKT